MKKILFLVFTLFVFTAGAQTVNITSKTPLKWASFENGDYLTSFTPDSAQAPEKATYEILKGNTDQVIRFAPQSGSGKENARIFVNNLPALCKYKTFLILVRTTTGGKSKDCFLFINAAWYCKRGEMIYFNFIQPLSIK